jgi:hypothetical protein
MEFELKIDIPDSASAVLQQRHVSPVEYAREVLRSHFETLALGDEGNIENRPDWLGTTATSNRVDSDRIPDKLKHVPRLLIQP